LRSQSKCTQNVIGGYIGGKMIQSPQFTQDVPTGFQVTSPPVIARAPIMAGWKTRGDSWSWVFQLSSIVTEDRGASGAPVQAKDDLSSSRFM